MLCFRKREIHPKKYGKKIVNKSKEKRGNNVIGLSRKMAITQKIMYTLIDDNWMHLQGGGCFELPYMSIVDYNNISF